ncbi:MAG: BNR repeat-containing protein [Cyclobacteriaceae bacterium]
MHGFLLTLSFIVVVVESNLAQVKVQEESISIVDDKALTIKGRFGQAINGKSFQQDALVTHRGFQYLAYYDEERHVCIARRKLPSGQWESIRFLDYDFTSNDAHNVVSLGICPNDGTIHLAFDHHVHELNYRVSDKGLANKPEQMEWSVDAFSQVNSELEKGKTIKVTYPRFWQTPEGNLQLCYRRGGSGNGDRMLADYDGQKGIWKNTRQIDSGDGLFRDDMGPSESRCSYPNGYNYDSKGNLHATWVWREDSQGANHDLAYVYSDDQGNSWKNNAGEVLKEIPHVNSPEIVAQSIPRSLGLMNTHGQTVDSKDRVHVVMYHCTEKTIKEVGSTPGELRWGPDEAKRYHHYWRDANGDWNHFEMDFKVGNRPKVFADKSDNLMMIFSGQASNNKEVPEDQKDLFIAVATAKKEWKDWKIIHSVKGPFVNEMLGDFYRWKSEGILSVIVQDFPQGDHEPSILKVVDLSFTSQ